MDTLYVILSPEFKSKPNITFTSNGLHGVISQNKELFTTIAVRTAILKLVADLEKTCDNSAIALRIQVGCGRCNAHCWHKVQWMLMINIFSGSDFFLRPCRNRRDNMHNASRV
jgi:hypothetical protein